MKSHILSFWGIITSSYTFIPLVILGAVTQELKGWKYDGGVGAGLSKVGINWVTSVPMREGLHAAISIECSHSEWTETAINRRVAKRNAGVKVGESGILIAKSLKELLKKTKPPWESWPVIFIFFATNIEASRLNLAKLGYCFMTHINWKQRLLG